MTMKNKETLEKLRTYQIGVIRSVIASRQGRLGTYSADATDRERLADTDGLAYEEYYESPLTIGYDGLCRNVISLEFCEDGLTPVCLMDGGDGFPLPLENLSCDTLQGIVEWLEEYDFIPSAEAAPQTTSDLTEDFVERCLPEYPTGFGLLFIGGRNLFSGCRFQAAAFINRPDSGYRIPSRHMTRRTKRRTPWGSASHLCDRRFQRREQVRTMRPDGRMTAVITATISSSRQCSFVR